MIDRHAALRVASAAASSVRVYVQLQVSTPDMDALHRSRFRPVSWGRRQARVGTGADRLGKGDCQVHQGAPQIPGNFQRDVWAAAEVGWCDIIAAGLVCY